MPSSSVIAPDTSPTRTAREPRDWSRPVFFGVALAVLGLGAVVAILTLQAATAAGRVGADLDLYLDAVRRVLGGGSFYPAHQLTGPYVLTDGDILYPPLAIAFFVPFLVLPAVLFWIIPLGILIAVVVSHRPRPWTWPLLAVGLAFPISSLKLVHGNPVMWIAAAAALGTVFAWPAVLVLLKPSLAPFSLIGIRRRSWWLGLGILAVAAVPFGTMWLDYIRVIVDSRNPAGALYSLDEVPFMLIPLIAWIGSPRFSPPRLPRRLERQEPAA
jgi:hypothetical protein